VVVVYAGGNGWADTVPVPEVLRFEAELREYFRAHHADLLATIATTGTLPAEADLDAALRAFLDGFDTGKAD
jgi:F-type H+-transporting ATPase subunit alpha